MQYYYINQASEQAGPADIDQLIKLGVTRETLVWKEGMKDWVPAGTVPELKVLFAVKPPPFVKKADTKTTPALPVTATAAISPNKKLKKIIIPAAAAFVLVIAAFLIFRPGGSTTDDNKLVNADSSLLASNDSISKKDTVETDTVKLVNLDSLASNLNWDTAAKKEGGSNEEIPSFLPGFGGGGNESSSSKNSKKTTTKKPTKYTPGQQEDERPGRSPEPDRAEPEKINPVRYLSVTGSFRRNIVFEGILEGSIQNRYSAQVKDIIIEARFLDDSGQPIGTKRFTQHGPLAGGSSIPFKFKTMPPKGTKNARYEIIAASLR